MTINKIQHYEMIEISMKEDAFFNINHFENSPPKKTNRLSSINNTELKDGDGSFVIGIAADGNLSWWIDENGPDKINLIIRKIRKGQITKAIAEYRINNPQGKLFIKGDKDSKYPDFEFVIEELKQANEYKYELITEK
jgi:biopolymer transport protein ExbD